jgi:hypothetical protein
VAGGYGWRQERNRLPVEEAKIETPGERLNKERRRRNGFSQGLMRNFRKL